MPTINHQPAEPSTPLDSLFPDHPELAAQIRAQDTAFAHELLERLTRPLPTEHVSDWVARNVAFDEPKFRGPFNFKSRNYIREPLNLWKRDITNDITDLIICWATRSAKTRVYMAGLSYRIALDPVRALITKPMKHGAGGSRNDARTKFVPMLKASPGLALAVARCDKNALNFNQQMLNGSILDWEGTGSPKQLSGNPDDVVVQDECDGYILKGETEAHPSVLADERTKDASNPLRYKSCSPTVEDGVIWKWLMRSDCRRRFLPCPRCSPLASSPSPPRSGGEGRGEVAQYTFQKLVENKFFLLAWSEQYHVLPNKMPDGTAIPIAYVHWDKTAKNRDGSWDYAKVQQTAHIKCPHCAGIIHNFEKEWMDEHGQWHPTKIGAPGIAGYQLSSLYVTHDETAWGILAKKFLMAHESGKDMKGFINNDLAEVHTAQEHAGNKLEINTIPLAGPDWVPLLTADFHKNHPYIWFVARKWCAFKLLPPFPITNGRPDFAEALELDENADVKKTVLQLAALPGTAATAANAVRQDLSTINSQLWTVLAELMRFDSRTGRSPIIDFLISQKITGKALVKLYREDSGGDTLTFRKKIYELMGAHTGHPARVPRGGDSELIAAGYCDLSGEACWEELADIIKEFQIGKGMPVPERCVAIDCGFAEKFNRVVLQKCYETATAWKFYDPLAPKTRDPVFWQTAKHAACQRAPLNGWQALRGKPTFRPLGGGVISRDIGLHIEDPYYGTPNGGTMVVDVLEIPTDLFWLKTNDLRTKKTKQVYTQSPETSWYPKLYQPDGTRTEDSKFKREDYERHLNEQIFDDLKNVVRPRHGKGGAQSRAHPYHLGDCETYQTALASHLEFFEDTKPTTNGH